MKNLIKRLTLFLQTNLFIYVFIFFAIVMKFMLLGTFPPGMAHDEMDMVLSSKAISETGHDLSGEPFPTFFVRSGMEAQQTNVIPFLLSPYFKFVDVNILTSRIPFVFINLLLGIGIIKLVRVFNKDKLLTLSVAIVFLASPWMFAFGRRTFAAPTSLMFLVWGMYFLYKDKEEIKKSVILFVISTLCYIGSIVVVVPAVFLLFAIKYFSKKKRNYKYLSWFFIYFFVIFLYILSSYFIDGGIIKNREKELGTVNSSKLSEQVDDLRRLTLEFPGKDLVINKYTVTFVERSANYFNSFGVDSLFFTGDPRFTYTFSDHGLLYLIDFALIILGIISIQKNTKKLLLVVGAVAATAAIGPAANIVLYSIIYRAFPLALVFVILTSFGLWEVVKINPYGPIYGPIYLYKVKKSKKKKSKSS